MSMLSCECYCDSADWYWRCGDEDVSPLDTKKARKCTSCGALIPVGADCLTLDRWRDPRGEYEEQRFGDEVPLAPYFFCPACAEIYQNLTASGLCVVLGDMREALREYWHMTGFDPEKYKSADSAADHGANPSTPRGAQQKAPATSQAAE
ncbi:hypothetical protein [Desulfovibrio desulfuricans]|uniref:hypothetical protein n=1 Tax=Desulfovibrio desulfuricans TaxID=876 RepID=UPI00398400C8